MFDRSTMNGITATRAMRRVLSVLLTDAANLTGATITRAAGISAARAYACLDRLEDHAWVASDTQGHRRVYRLTPTGWTDAHRLLCLIPSHVRRG